MQVKFSKELLKGFLENSKSIIHAKFFCLCQEFVFEGVVIKRVQTFKYLGILLETTPNLYSAVEHLAADSRRLLFALNRRYAELPIMDVKLHCDLFNTLVRSIASYACEV